MAVRTPNCKCLVPQVLYNAVLENNCSEQAARMTAMENSTKNASEILEKLTLSYNRYCRTPSAVIDTHVLLGCVAFNTEAWPLHDYYPVWTEDSVVITATFERLACDFPSK